MTVVHATWTHQTQQPTRFPESNDGPTLPASPPDSGSDGAAKQLERRSSDTAYGRFAVKVAWAEIVAAAKRANSGERPRVDENLKAPPLRPLTTGHERSHDHHHLRSRGGKEVRFRGAPLHPPPRSGGGGPPAGRWRGRGLAVIRRRVKHSRAQSCHDARFFIALTRGSSAAPSTTLRVVPLPRFTGAEKEGAG